MADDPNSFYVFGTKVQKGKRPVQAAGTLTSPYDISAPDATSGPDRGGPMIPKQSTAAKTKPVTVETRAIKIVSAVPKPRMKPASPTDNGPTFKHQNSYLKSLGQNSPSKGNSFRRYDEKK